MNSKSNLSSKKNLLKIGIASVMAIFVTILFSTCNIGLGHAVDTEAPTIEVLEPSANSIVRDKFVMSGTWDDDGEIEILTVTIVNTSTRKALDPIKATFDAESKTWACEIDPFLAETRLLDGSYEATMAIKDTYNHETKASVAFKIDNTPPLVILTRPATKKDAVNPDSYGCEFTLEGEAVDDNTISLVEVEVYDFATNELKATIPLQNVAKKIDRSVATFGASDEFYETIYGKVPKDSNGEYDLSNVGTKKFYCKVVAYDDARKVPAEEGDKGNRIEEFYLLSEISKYISDYKSLGFYQIINETYKPDSSARYTYTVDDIKKVIEDKKLEKASFSLDPRNNPKYKVSGRNNIAEMIENLGRDTEVLKSTAARLNNNSTIEIGLYAGLDNYYIDKDTVGIYLQECDADGKIISDEKIILFPKYKTKSGDVYTDDIEETEWTDEAVAERDARFKVSGSTYSVDVTIGTKSNEKLKVGKCYKFVVEGYDEGGNGIFNYGKTDYAFKLQSVNATPTLMISELSGNLGGKSSSTTSIDLRDTEKLTIKGLATLEDLAPNIEFYYGLESTDKIDNKSIGAATFKNDGYTITIPDTYKNQSFILRVVARNPEEQDQTASKEIAVTYDCKGPEIGDVAITPTVELDGKEYVNGKVKLKSSVEDALNTVKLIEYTITGIKKDKTESSTTDRDTIGNIGSGFIVDTTQYKDKTDITVTIYATDKPGNESSKPVVLHIDQSTDAPVVEFNNADTSITTTEKIKNMTAASKTNNIFGMQSNNRISAAISDDDGIEKVVIYKKNTGVAGATFEPETVLENGKSTNYTLNNIVSKTQGEYAVYLVVTDSKHEATGYNTTRIPSAEDSFFLVAVDEGAPNFMITSPNNALQAEGKPINVSGTVSDGTPVTINRYKYVKVGTSEAFDSKNRYFLKDENTYSEQVGITSFESGKSYYKIVSEADSSATSSIKIDTASHTWTDIIPDSGSEGNILLYEAMDAYGQTTAQPYIYSIDSYPPVFSITQINSNKDIKGYVAPAAREDIFIKAVEGSYLTIAGTVEDQYVNDATKSRGLDDFVYYKLTKDELTATNNKYDITGWSTTKKIDSGRWTQAIDLDDAKLADGDKIKDGVKYILYIVAKDAAGNLSDNTKNPSAAVYIIPDGSVPSITVTSTKKGGDEVTTEGIQILDADKTKTITFTATISDPVPTVNEYTCPTCGYKAYVRPTTKCPNTTCDALGTTFTETTVATAASGIESIKLYENGKEYDSTKYTKSPNTNASGTYTFSVAASSLEDKDYNFEIHAIDKAGNATKVDLKPISKDAEKPTVSISGISPYVVDESDNTVYNGKIDVRVNVSDNKALRKLDWWIENKSGTMIGSKTTLTDCANKTTYAQRITVDTDKLTQDDGTFVFVVQATDNAGNTSLLTVDTGTNNTPKQTFVVKQSTDQPKITFNGSTSGEITTLDLMKAAAEAGNIDNIFGSTTNNILEFTVTDDDGIAEIKVTATKQGAATAAKTETFDGSKVTATNPTQYPKTKKIKFTMPSDKDLYDIKIEVKDCKLETTKYKTNEHNIVAAVDDKKPEIKEFTTDIEEHKSTDDNYYINKDFKITFDVSDDYKLDSLTYIETVNDVAQDAQTVTVVKNNTTQSISIPITKRGTTGQTTTVTNIITLKDIFGRTAQKEITYVFDLEAPKFTTNYPQYKVGGAAVTSNAGDWYGETKATVNITPYVTDNKEVETVEFGVFKTTKTPEQLDDTDATEWYTVPGANKTSSASSSSRNITLGEGTNYIYVRAKDKAGNVTYSPYFRRNIDMSSPSATIVKPSNTVLINGDNDIEFEANVSDVGDAGIDKVEVYVQSITASKLVCSTNETGTKKLTMTDGTGGVKNVTGSINKSYVDAANYTDGRLRIYVVTTDKAGNQSSKDITLDVDDEAPTVEFTSHSDDNTVNKTIEIRGNARDNQFIDQVILEVATTNTSSTTWTKIGDSKNPITGSDFNLTGSVWTYNLDTMAAPLNIVDKSDIYLRVTAKDTALNSASKTLKLKVDQDTDRPIVTLDLDKNGAITSKDNFRISVDDDDGLSGIVLKVSTATTKPTDWSGITAVKLTNGSGTFTYTGEGTKNFWLYVEDAKGGKFITNIGATGQTALNAVPYIKFTEKGTAGNNTANVTFIYDNTPATISLKAYGFGDTEAKATAGATKAAADGAATSGSDYAALSDSANVFGGTKKKFVTFAVKVNDTNGVDSVVISSQTGGINGEFTTTASNGNGVWYYSVEIATVKQAALTITVVDKAGVSYSTDPYPCTFDNTPPSLTNFNQDQTVNPVTLTGVISDTGVGIETKKYLLLNNTYYNDNGTVKLADVIAEFNNASSTKVKELDYKSGSDSIFEITFNDLPTTGTDLTSYSKIPHPGDIYTLKVYFKLVDKLGNVLGGENNLYFEEIEYNPYGNRPTSAVNNPEGTVEAPASVNGTVRISGSAAKGSTGGAQNLGAVYVQFDVNKDGVIDDDDKTLLLAEPYAGKYDVCTSSNVKTDIGLSAADSLIVDALNGETFWGIRVSGVEKGKQSASWFININADLEFQNETQNAIAGKENTYLVGVRSVAVAEDGTFGSWSKSQYLMIDNNIPVFDNAPIIVASDDTSQAYVPDMYLKGTNYIQVGVVDKEGITEVRVYTAGTKQDLTVKDKVISAKFSAAGTSTVDIEKDGPTGSATLTTYSTGSGSSEKTGFTIKYPISTAASTGTKYIKVEAFKENGNSAYEIYNVNFDNTAPTIDSFALNSVNYASSDKKIVNSNGVFTLGGKMTDEQSGYERVGFYFIRGKGTKYETRIYNPLKIKDDGKISLEAANDTIASKTLKTGFVTKSFGVNASSTLHSTPQSMYGKEYTISSVGSVKIDSVEYSTLTFASALDSNISAGGLVEIDGTFLRIKKVDSTTKVTVTKTTAEAEKTAFFPYLWVVDNTGAEKTDLDGLSFTTPAQQESDDGDGMPESIIKNNRTWAWDATIQSMYIPDGPGTVVMFAWDKAGNMSAASYDVSVQNNAPRLVKLHLGTDLNGSGDEAGATAYYEDNEFVSYDVLTEVGKQTAYSAMQTKRYTGKSFRVKNKLAVVPEFVGGNFTASDANGIIMIVNTAAEGETTVTINGNNKIGTANYYKVDSTKAKFAASSKIQTGVGKTNIDTLDSNGKIKNEEVTNNIWLFELTNNQLGSQSSDTSKGENGTGDRAFSFTFWDKTADTTQGVDSSYCYLRITDLIIDTVDTSKPEAKITPFYWNSKEDSSTPLDDSGMPLGHIDLEEDIGKTNPGVSGQVYVRGTVWDNTRLYAIYIKAPDGKSYKIAEYAGGNWTVAKRVGTGIKYYKYTEADGEEEITTGAPNWATVASTSPNYAAWGSNIKGCTIEKDYGVTQDGHKAEWCLEIDMTPYGVKKNNNVIAYAEDAAKKANGDNNHQTSSSAAAAQTKTSALTSTYIMDFVPYIKSVESVAGANYTVRRSRLGRYPVRAGATIRINGMNFAKDAAYSVAFYKTNATTGKQADKANSWTALDDWSGEIPSDGYIEITAPNYSCFVEVTVAGEKTQNNTNKNDVGYNIQKGSYKGKGTSFKGDLVLGDDFWTDDCYLSVWNVSEDTLFPGSVNPHSGVIKKVDKYNSGSGVPSDVGAKNVSAAPGPGGGYLYKQPGDKSQVDLLTGMNDSYYAAISSDDLKLYGYVSGQTYGSHGDNIAYNLSEVAYMCPVDEMDYTIVNGTPYYVLQDNGLGGDSGSVWGMGLAMMREGIWYDRQYCSPIKGNTMEEEKLPFYVERQGYGTASHKRNSSSGYDSVLYQFKNPRIAGCYNSKDWLLYQTKDGGGTVKGVDYIYISYFDSYAKCLKYAAYKVGHRFLDGNNYSKTDLKEWGKNDVDHDIDIVAMMSSSPILKQQTFDDNGNVTDGNTLTSNQTAQKAFNHMRDGKSVVAGSDYYTNNPSPTTVVGEWSDILVDPVATGKMDIVDPNDAGKTISIDVKMPIIVYYNMTAKSLEIARGTTAFPQSKDDWSYTEGIRPEGSTDFGRYCSAAIDDAGNLHIAAQDADSAKLYYLYMKRNGGKYSIEVSVAVDGTNGAGRWTDIELTDPSKTTSIKDMKPVISYINTGFLGTTSGVKVAYLESVEGTGANIKLHFEAMTDPAQYTAGDQRTSVLPHVKETKAGSIYAPVAVGFNSDKLALDFLRGEQ